MPGAHKKKTKGAKVKKRKADTAKQARRAEKAAGGAGDGGSGRAADEAARQRNPKAFIFSGSGKAKKNAARTAEKEQRRMHGEPPESHAPDSKQLLNASLTC